MPRKINDFALDRRRAQAYGFAAALGTAVGDVDRYVVVGVLSSADFAQCAVSSGFFLPRSGSLCDAPKKVHGQDDGLAVGRPVLR